VQYAIGLPKSSSQDADRERSCRWTFNAMIEYTDTNAYLRIQDFRHQMPPGDVHRGYAALSGTTTELGATFTIRREQRPNVEIQRSIL
jgi:hypothetical protein